MYLNSNFEIMKTNLWLFSISLFLIVSCNKNDNLPDYQISIVHNQENQEFIMQIPSYLTIKTIENSNCEGGKKSGMLTDYAYYTDPINSPTSVESGCYLSTDKIACGLRARCYGDNCVGVDLYQRSIYEDGTLGTSSWTGTGGQEGWQITCPTGTVIWSIAVRVKSDNFATVVVRYADYDDQTMSVDAPPPTDQTSYSGTRPQDSGYTYDYTGERYFDPYEADESATKTVVTGLGFIVTNDNVYRLVVRTNQLPD